MNEDRRTRRTRESLYEALVALSQEIGFDAIKVSDLTAHARIGRSTFYRHYRDKYDLVTELARAGLPGMTTVADGRPGRTTAIDMAHGVFRHIAEHRSLYLSLLSQQRSQWFANWLQSYLQRSAELHAALSAGDSAQRDERLAAVTAMSSQSLIAALTWWLENGTAEQARTVAAWYVDFTQAGFDRLAGRPAPAQIWTEYSLPAVTATPAVNFR